MPQRSLYHSDTAIDQQIALLCMRAKAEIAVHCRDWTFAEKYADVFSQMKGTVQACVWL
ncbi:MAG: hypothetical protein LBU24_00695 [Methanocalculaceae archaeon]|jgi:hypothetical protein|nr:hypothetical protein [Methanocalculaceae archaeon]